MNLNWWAIIVSVLFMNIVGMVWYGETALGKEWRRLVGISDADMEAAKKTGGPWKAMGVGMLASVVMVYVLAHIVYTYQATDILSGLMGGFWVWLGFFATTMLNGVLYERRPLRLYAINVGYYLVTLLAAGALLALWR
jgi:hypothetical protein